MATLDVKFTKFDNRPWGFRLAGGSDFPQPLTVIRVTEGGLAECMGLKVGDVIVKLNDQPMEELTHAKAHEALTLAGNNFVFGVRRTEDPSKSIEGIEEKIEPYMLPIEEILFAPIEEKRDSTPDEAPQIQDEEAAEPEEPEEPEEVYPEKPRDENSEIVANPKLTDEEIAQLILDEEEVLTDKGVLGVNFKKLRPRAALLKGSKVFEELKKEIEQEPAPIKELKHQTTFLQKPDRPVPRSRTQSEAEPEPKPEPYKVVIKKQPKKSVAERLVEKGLLEPSRVKTPETTGQPSEKTTPSATPEPSAAARHTEPSESESRPQSQADVIEITEATEINEEAKEGSREESTPQPVPRIEEPADDEETGQKSAAAAAAAAGGGEEEEPAKTVTVLRRPSKAEVDVEVAVTMDRDKIKELVTTEISLERQLASVQSQLLALKELPSEIEKHLKIVSEQLNRIMELSGVEQHEKEIKDAAAAKAEAEEREQQQQQQQAAEQERERQREEEQQQQQQTLSVAEDDQHSLSSRESSSWAPNLMSEDETWTESKELEISVKSNEDDGNKRIKKFIVSYESKVLQEKEAIRRSREPSPAVSHGSFEPDPKLTIQEQLVQELQHRKERKRPRELLWQPQARQLELTYGRRWRCPNDFFNDDMIADALCSQAEVIRGKAMGVNFKKFERKALPNFDHLQNSSVYKMIHKMEPDPKKGIPARPPKVIAAEDIIERVNTPVCCMADDRSVRSISH